MKNIKKIKIVLLKLKTTVSEMKNIFDVINDRLGIM